MGEATFVKCTEGVSGKARLATHINVGKDNYANRSEGRPRERKVPEISHMGKINYTKHFEGTSMANYHDSHHRAGKLSALVVEKMLEKILLADLFAHK